MIKKNISFIIFIFYLSLYILTMNGYVANIDTETTYAVTKSIVEKHEPSVSPGLIRGVWVKPGKGGKLYAVYGIGQSALAVPFFVMGKIVSHFFEPSLEEFITRFTVMFLNVVITALWCVLVFKFSLLFRFSTKISIVLCLAFGLSTMAWPYSKYLFSEPALGLFVTLSLYLLLNHIIHKKTRLLILSGLSLGIAIMVKLVAAVVLPVYLFYLIYKFRNLAIRKIIKYSVIFLLPIFLAILIIMFYNYIRFGNILETGYPEGKVGVLPFGIYGLLFSPGKSLFIYSPILALFFLAFKKFYYRYKAEAFLFLGVFCSFLLLYSSVVEWDGGVCWGTRYMLPVIPLLIIPLGVLLESTVKYNSKALKALFVILALSGVLVQLLPVLVRYDIYIDEVGKTVITDLNPRYFPIIGQAKKLWQINFVPFKDSAISGLDIHNKDFKNEFSKTIDLWFMYLAKFRAHQKLSFLAFIPFTVFVISSYLLLACLRRNA